MNSVQYGATASVCPSLRSSLDPEQHRKFARFWWFPEEMDRVMQVQATIGRFCIMATWSAFSDVDGDEGCLRKAYRSSANQSTHVPNALAYQDA